MTVAMVFIDTILLAGKTDPKDMYSSPCGADSQKAADDQWVWINQTLANYSKPGSRVGWKFVVGHYPGMRLMLTYIVHSNIAVTVCGLIMAKICFVQYDCAFFSMLFCGWQLWQVILFILGFEF